MTVHRSFVRQARSSLTIIERGKESKRYERGAKTDMIQTRMKLEDSTNDFNIET